MNAHITAARALTVLVVAAGLTVTPTAAAMASPAIHAPVLSGDAPPPPPPPHGGMHYNDDVPLDTSQVTDARGCTDPDPNICNWSDEKYRKAKEAEGN